MAKQIVLYREKAEQLATSALETRSRGLYPFNYSPNELYPDAVIPVGIEREGRKQALYQFHACNLDSNRKAPEVYRAAQLLHDSLGGFDELHKIPRERIEAVLNQVFGENDKKRKDVDVLMHNSAKLHREYEGDPRNLREADENVWDTIRRISGFEQYGVGKSALLMKNFVRFGIWNIPETDIPIKVDRHILRMCLSQGVVDYSPFEEVAHVKEKSTKLTEAIRLGVEYGYYTKEELDQGRVMYVKSARFVRPLMNLFLDITKSKKISAIELDDSLWAIGSCICNKNRVAACISYCFIGCQQRFPSDNNSSWFFTRVGDKPLDKRVSVGGLFS